MKTIEFDVCTVLFHFQFRFLLILKSVSSDGCSANTVSPRRKLFTVPHFLGLFLQLAFQMLSQILF